MQPLLPRPANINFEESSLDLRFEKKWFSATYIFLIFFLIFWWGFLVFWYSIVLGIDNEMKWIFLLFPLIHVGVGVFLLYTTLAGFLNKTTVKVDKTEVGVKHSPLPWKGNKTVNRYNVKQLYTKKTITQSRNGTTVKYDLMVILEDDTIVKLLTGLEASEEAKFIERKIENFWNIMDVRVEGEYAGE